ncbi:MAG: hypothetical protein PVH84_03760 [Candidatus Aminicenantes bacterium]|jgi:hypothetical protein
MLEKYDPLKGEMLQILNERGEVKGDLEPKLSAEDLRKLYAFAEVAKFMNDLVNLLENPSLLLIESDTQRHNKDLCQKTKILWRHRQNCEGMNFHRVISDPIESWRKP